MSTCNQSRRMSTTSTGYAATGEPGRTFTFKSNLTGPREVNVSGEVAHRCACAASLASRVGTVRFRDDAGGEIDERLGDLAGGKPAGVVFT